MPSLFIKNMVCRRCIMAVGNTLNELHIPYRNIELGEVELADDINSEQRAELSQRLHSQGFDLLSDQKAQTVERIKALVIELVHGKENFELQQKLSVYISEQLGHDYKTLSSLFSAVEGITLEKFVILQKIEKAKEYIRYNELSMSEIADRLGYSSVHHLSQQFKQITGLTPSHFRQSPDNQRKALDLLGK